MRLIKPEDELIAKGRARSFHFDSHSSHSKKSGNVGSSEAVFKVISHIKGGGKSARMISYVTRYHEGDEHKTMMDYISHDNEIVMRNECNEQVTHEQVVAIKERWGKEFESQDPKSRVMSHFVFSSDKIKDAQVFADVVGKTLDRSLGRDGFEYLYAIHEEKDHMHCHVLVNTHSKVLDRKLHISKAFCAEQRANFAEVAREHGYQHHTSLKRDRAQAKELKPWEVDARAMDYVRLRDQIREPSEKMKSELEQLKKGLPSSAIKSAEKKYAQSKDKVYQSRLKQVRYLESVHKRGAWTEASTYKLLEVDYLNKDSELKKRLTALYPENVDKAELKARFAKQQAVVAQIKALSTLKELNPQKANRLVVEIEKAIPTVAMNDKYRVQMEKGLHAQVREERVEKWTKQLDRAQTSLSKQDLVSYQRTVSRVCKELKGKPKETVISSRLKGLQAEHSKAKNELTLQLKQWRKEKKVMEKDCKESKLTASQRKTLFEGVNLKIAFAERQLGIQSKGHERTREGLQRQIT